MSTNKTPNYQLHSWEPGDNFLLTEINANFADLDAAVNTAQIVTGTYNGTGSSTTIELGFRPRAVLALSQCYQFSNQSQIIPVALAIDGYNAGGYLCITDQGFLAASYMARVEDYSSEYYPCSPFRYIAWR